MLWFNQLFRSHPSSSSSDRCRVAKRARTKTAVRRQIGGVSVERLEKREVFSAEPLPVLMVLADKQDFYYREYAETRQSLEDRGLTAVVAATTRDTTYPHPGTGQGATSGAVNPDLALSDVNPDDFSAIVFVGGWGASMYQYAYNDPNSDGSSDNFYSHAPYNGDSNLGDGQIAAQKLVVNQLINAFLAQDKHVAGICHGVTVLAWARVDGVSPIQGRRVAVPTTVSSPDQFYAGQWRSGGYMLGQYDQVIANGGIASNVSGSIGNPRTAADDVIVDGRIITAENFDSSRQFGLVIAQQILDALPDGPVQAVQMVGDDLIVQGTAGSDAIYIWSGAGNTVSVWINGVSSGPFALPASGHVKVFAGGSDDRVIASDLMRPAEIHGGDGHDLLVGGFASDEIDGGAGVDRIWGGVGDDFLNGGSGNDFLYGREGNDILVGGTGNDYLEGFDGADILIGGLGVDQVNGGFGEDILIGGTTVYDNNLVALKTIHATWNGGGSVAMKRGLLSNGTSPVRLSRNGSATVLDDLSSDTFIGGSGVDWFFGGVGEQMWPVPLEDLLD